MAFQTKEATAPIFNMDGGNTETNPNQFPLIPGGFGNPTGASTINSTGGVLPLDANSIHPVTAPAAANATHVDGGTTNIPLGDSPIVPTATPTNPTPTTPGSPVPVGGNIADMNVAQGLGLFNNPEFAKSLDAIFGPGFGTAISSYINNGAGYNPKVAEALIKQMQPAHDQGNAAIREAFGAAGTGYSSSAALGLSDFESKFSQNEMAALANLYNESANRESNIFSSMFDAASLHEANKLSTFDKVSQGLGLGKGVLDLLKQLFGGKSSSSSSGKGTPSSPGQNGSTNVIDMLKDIFGHGSFNAPTGGQGLSQFPGFSPEGTPPDFGSLGLGDGISSQLGDVLGLGSPDVLLDGNSNHAIDYNPSSDGSIDWSALWGSMDSAGDVGVASGYDTGGGAGQNNDSWYWS